MSLTPAGQHVRDRIMQPDDERSPDDPVRQSKVMPCCKEHEPGRVCLLEDGHEDVVIDVTLLIDNFYGGDKIKTTVETQVSFPPPDRASDEFNDWEQDEIFQHTGTGQESGDSCYFVTVASSSRPEIIPVGTEYEFGT